MQSNGSMPFSEDTIRSVMQSAAGKQLLALLTKDGGAALRAAAAALKRGDTAAAQAAVAPIMGTEEAARLARELNEAERSRHAGT